jgi:ATPases involved in chromosome partitioning
VLVLPIIISLINVKGGVGKTMTAINLAGEMAEMGRKVLLIDNDSQSSLTQILNLSHNYTMYDLYDNNKVFFEDCIVEFDKNIFVVPNCIDSAILESDLHSRRMKERILEKKFSIFTNNFDFVIIDNSPFLGLLVQNSLVMSDYYLPIIDNSPSALQGLNMVDRVIRSLNDIGLARNIKLLGILRNRFEKRSIFSRQFTEVVEEELQSKLFKTVIYDSVKYKEASALHTTIQSYSKKHAHVYKDLYYEMMDKINIIESTK